MLDDFAQRVVNTIALEPNIYYITANRGCWPIGHLHLQVPDSLPAEQQERCHTAIDIIEAFLFALDEFDWDIVHRSDR